MFSQIFPLQDATLYSKYPEENTGLDPILEFTKTGPTEAARILMQFGDTDLQNTFKQLSGSWKSYLRLYASEAENLPTIVPIEVNALSQSWDQGTGRFGNIPTTKDGATWLWPKTGSSWTTGGTLYVSGTYVTASYIISTVSSTGSLSSSAGGGSWFVTPYAETTISQYTPQDLWIDVTNIVACWSASVLPNNGFILRVSESVESDPNYQYKLQYFSRDTNTIYPPSLMFFWNDSKYNPYNTTSQQVLTNDQFDISIGNNDGVYYSGDKPKIYVYARDKYPQRQFVTSSLYEYNKLLPSQSFYQVIDVDTNETIIPFNDPGTLISTESSSYFRMDMSTLEPERWYQYQIKVTIDGGTYIKTVTDTKFKVSQTIFP